MSKVPRGKTPSLIGSSLGRPTPATAGKLCQCSRCGSDITKGEKCFDVQQPQKSFNATRRFCPECFQHVLEQTGRDLDALKAV